MWELLGYLAQSALVLVTFCSKKVWFVVANYPLYSLGVLATWKFVALIRRKRRHRAKVRELFPVVLEAVYDRLSEVDNSEGYAALLLRDDVCHHMYPTTFCEQQFVNDHAWPRTRLDIWADNRI